MLDFHHLILPASVFAEQFQAYILPKAIIVFGCILVVFSTLGAISLNKEHKHSIHRAIEKVLEYYYFSGDPVVEFRLNRKKNRKPRYQLPSIIEVKTVNQQYYQLLILKNKISTTTDIPTFTLEPIPTQCFVGEVDPSKHDKYKIFEVNEVLK